MVCSLGDVLEEFFFRKVLYFRQCRGRSLARRIPRTTRAPTSVRAIVVWASAFSAKARKFCRFLIAILVSGKLVKSRLRWEDAAEGGDVLLEVEPPRDPRCHFMDLEGGFLLPKVSVLGLEAECHTEQ